MPENDNHHPRHTVPEDGVYAKNPKSPYVELGLFTCFSFLRGASDAADLALEAWSLGYHALGVADLNSLAGVVRIHAEAKKTGLRPVIGARIALISGEVFLAYPRNRAAYGRLSQLISKGRMQDPDGVWQAKGVCDLTLRDLAEHADGIQLIAVPPRDLRGYAQGLARLAKALPTLKYLAASFLYHGNDRARITQLDRMAGQNGLRLLATNDVLYHTPARRPLQDVMTCIRHKTTLAQAGHLLEANGERHLKSPAEMQRLFAEWPHAIAATRSVADACLFDLTELAYEYPSEVIPKD
ncbi:MAG: error-prone DNA polymerase, partial [Alphaproteobacteria bacterium]|nr:error-prone DNA polymerase [Alphaproteobacteria bacterium]